MKLSISFTDAHVRLIEEAVQSGHFASASEVVRAAMAAWAPDAAIGVFWDQGVTSGRAKEQMSMADIKAEAKRRMPRAK